LKLLDDTIGLLPIWGFAMRAVGAIVLAICSFWLFSEPALAGKRVALVIGNSAYQNVSRLTNPTNDSEAMSATLRSVGFDVVDLRRDLKASEMRRALRDFSDSVRDADMAVIYYAGHGIEIDGSNYIIPVDAVLERDIDAFDEAISLDRLLTVIEPAKQLRLVILDACRDNPFNKTMKRTIAARSIGRGLAKVEPTSPNTLIAFAAKAGSTASDGDSKNSPFTAALVKYLPRPGLDLRKAFGFTRDEVLKVTNNKQEPFVYGSLGGEDVALVPAAKPVVPAVAAAGPPAGPEAAIRRTYELALEVGTQEVWDSFIANYPNSFYTELAKAQRRKLAAEEARLIATEKAKAAQQDQARLAMEGAKVAEQAKAAAQAKAAEQARIAAENKKTLEDAKVADAERAKAAAQAKAEEDARIAAEKAAAKAKAAEDARFAQQARIAADKQAREDAKAAEAERAKAAAQAKVDEDARIAAAKAKALEDARLAETERAKAAALAKAEADARIAADKAKAADENKAKDDRPVGRLAALAPPGDAVQKSDKPAPEDIPRLLQSELRRVGCNTGAVDGNWNAAAQKSLGLFNKSAGLQLDVRVASLDALDVVRSKPGRICPLICDHGYKADGDTCTKITCKAGYEVGDDNSCQRIEAKKPARREAPAATAAPKISPDRLTAEKPAERKSAGGAEGLYAKCAQSAVGNRGRNGTARFNAINACVMNGGRL
jgi:hypothetical protein